MRRPRPARSGTLRPHAGASSAAPTARAAASSARATAADRVSPVTPLVRRALEVAAAELATGVREEPVGSNRGPRVDEYNRGVHGDAGYLLRFERPKPGETAGPDGWRGAPWCARFVRWCVEEAARQLDLPRPFPKQWGDLASAHKLRKHATAAGIYVPDPYPGRIALMFYGRWGGHVALVTAIEGGGVDTIEGNQHNRVCEERRSRSAFAGYVDLEHLP